jgi:hypothetical protein
MFADKIKRRVVPIPGESTDFGGVYGALKKTFFDLYHAFHCTSMVV